MTRFDNLSFGANQCLSNELKRSVLIGMLADYAFAFPSSDKKSLINKVKESGGFFSEEDFEEGRKRSFAYISNISDISAERALGIIEAGFKSHPLQRDLEFEEDMLELRDIIADLRQGAKDVNDNKITINEYFDKTNVQKAISIRDITNRLSLRSSIDVVDCIIENSMV